MPLETMKIEQIKTLFMAMPDGFALFESVEKNGVIPGSFKFVFVNPSWEALFGVLQTCINGKLLDENRTVLENTLVEACAKTYECGEPTRIERYCPEISIWLLVNAYQISHDRIAVVVSDISERKNAEHQLIESEKRYRMFYEDAVLGIFHTTIGGRIIDVNPAMVTMFGYDSDTDFIDTVTDISRDMYADPEHRTDLIKHLSLSSKPVVRELIFKRKDASTFNGIIHIWPVRNNDHTLRYFEGFIEDITERRHMELQLREARQRLSSHMANTPLAVIEWDNEFTVLQWSDSASDLFGWTDEETQGERLSDIGILHNDHCNTVFDTKSRLLDGSSSGTAVTIRNYTKDGRIIVCEWYNSSLHDDNGKLVSILSLVHDVSERISAEDKIRENEKFIKAVTDTTPSILYLYDAAKNENTWVNARHRELCGSYDGSGSSDCIADFLHPDDRVHLSSRIHRLQNSLQNNGFDTVDYRLRGVSGEWRWFQDRATVFERDEKGHVKSILGSANDITDERNSRKRLKESEEQYRTLFEKTRNPIAVFDEQGVYIDCNQAFLQFLECNYDEFSQKSIADFTMAHDRSESIMSYIPSMTTGGVIEAACDINGKTKLLEMTITPVTLRGKRVVFGVGTDVTLQREAEHELKRSLHEKDVLLKEVHHRVKNNLQVISSLLNLQTERIPDPDLRNMYIESITRIHAMSTIHNMLYQSESFSHIHVDKYFMRIAQHLIYLYNSGGNRVKVEVEPSDINLDIDTAIPCGLIANELVSNALKYAFPGDLTGKIVISLKAVATNTVRLQVSDNGVGLPHDFSLDNTKTLGLKIVKNLTRQLHGSFDLENTRGTVAAITFSRTNNEKQ